MRKVGGSLSKHTLTPLTLCAARAHIARTSFAAWRACWYERRLLAHAFADAARRAHTTFTMTRAHVWPLRAHSCLRSPRKLQLKTSAAQR